eukprot:scpid41413/ scgid19886/ Serine/threonine-protein kinase CTR1
MPRSKGGGGGSVNVSGYYRANGTYVSGYTRSAPSSGSSSSSSSRASTFSGGGGDSVSVSGYHRSNGTYVNGYTRSASSGSSSSRPTSGGEAGSVSVGGYTRSNGTYVSGYTRSTPANSSSAGYIQPATLRPSSSSPAGGTRESSSTAATSTPIPSRSTGVEDFVHVDVYTRSDGTKVAVSHTGSTPGLRPAQQAPCKWTTDLAEALPAQHASIKQDPAFPGDTRKRTHYVDNSINRRLGRVGLPIPRKHGEHGHGLSSEAISRPQQLERIKSALYETTADEIRKVLEDHALSILDRQAKWEEKHAIQQAYDHHQRAEVEEEWFERGISATTDLQKVITSDQEADSLVIQQQEITLEKAIGHGGFGEVFAARYRGTVVAVKCLQLQAWSRSRIDTFKRELQVLSQVQHQNIVTVLGVVLDPPQFSIVMEYMRRSLFTALFLHEEQFSSDKQKTIVLEICAALEHLHAEGIAHCDVKAENVLLDEDDHANICDFGLSFIRSTTEVSSSRAGSATAPPGQGTPRYSAPEVLRGERLGLAQLYAADVYSLALVVYEVVVRKEAFIDYTLRQLERNVGNGVDRPDVSASPRILAATIQHLWDKDPSKRPPMPRVCELFNAINACYWFPPSPTAV